MKATGDNFRSDGTAVIPAGGEPQCGRNGGSWRRRGGGVAQRGGSGAGENKATRLQSVWLQVMQVLESQMSGQPVKPEVSAEERVERCREKQGLLESRCLAD